MDNFNDPIWAYRAPFLEQKLMQSQVFRNAEEFNAALNEFKKYCLLNKLGYQNLGMHSEKVDALWHQFILFTREYHDFCIEHLGSFLHHEPSLEQLTEAQSGFFQAYQSEFGQLNSLWLDGANCTAKLNCTAQLASRNCTAQVAS
ncbi:glycine-rich domain-containing protein [Vibrio ishigakensis]|nr:hypothetical protein [Vibrio ishigakensis]